MQVNRRQLLGAGVGASALLALPACSSSGDSGSGGDKKVEVFSWWSGPGEGEGLAALIEDFKKNNPGVEFVNAAVAGGSGTQARQVLTSRLLANQPPDSYQLHAGQEAASDIKDAKLEAIDYLYDANGWRDKFPKGLTEKLTINGKIYAVPVNIHRSNLLFFNPKKLTEWGITAPGKTWSELLAQGNTLKGKGVKLLSVATTWAQMHLMENVLLGELGADKYNGLWNGQTDWNGSDVVGALDVFKQLLALSAVSTDDWQPAIDKVIAGTAAFNVMGDWAAGYLQGAKALKYKTDYDVVASPGSAGVYNFLADSFTLPKGAPHKAYAEAWLKECASKEGQDLFNPKKGSVPARLDSDKSKYTDYLAWALGEWQNTSTVVVGSLVHGVVANNAWKAEIEKAYGVFFQDKDSKKFAGAIAAAYAANK
ncbi:MAG: carbohydrate ABC transporter substrate-binding protein [Hamadaea sp.]|uniref:ABC transporter substrate-binding protein n=1 Tax=Hamadaea sp. TaxID=2024425 RepID=UPI0017EEC343|nr:ABC transporter substrate-binding protein [Hamadaea sp.]NUR72108.1 carbohydrate ABC transporter substrate-binding protein [Hamadaea sp.]NUT22945.1 carbohydrate ABC transporter substrate-binding protein [Hamadaea sp.]